jgi:UDP-GlcNAc3NAcA epimerase
VTRRKVVTVVGTRPQFVKAAVVSGHLRALGAEAPVEEVLVHTGQHYEPTLSDVFFRDFGMPEPDHELDVGSGPMSEQLGRITERVAAILDQEQPDLVLVYGDTTSTLGAALAADHRDVPVVHVEAGERMFRRLRVPEESNRILVDHLSSLCLCVSELGVRHLAREGMAPERIVFVGDPMYDLFRWALDLVPERASIDLAALELEEGRFHLATVHRPENTQPAVLLRLLAALDRAELPVVMPVHPRVRDVLAEDGWAPAGSLRLVEPLGYFDLLRLLLACHHCVTDSGGVMREAFFAARPTVVPMQSNWWPQAVESGWAVNVGSDPDALLAALDAPEPEEPPSTEVFGGGRSAERIVEALAERAPLRKDEVAWHRHGRFAELPTVQATNFTYTHYRRMLTSLQERGYAFAAFPEAEELLAWGEPFVLLRHDIDMEVEKAIALAEVEAELGVAATYFPMTSTEHYNVFSASASAAVRTILELGHHLGLHFDLAAHGTNGALSIAEACEQEAELLESWFEREIEIVSFHRPSETLTEDVELSRPHTYLPLFHEPIRYFADSRGVWPRGEPTASPEFAEGRPLHVLVHPIWWNERPLSPHEALMRFVDRRTDLLERSLAANCEVYRVGRLAIVSARP